MSWPQWSASNWQGSNSGATNISAEQWANMQQHNWQQWANWQSQYMAWQQQYGEQYQQSMSALAGQSAAAPVQPPLPPTDPHVAQPPLPESKPPLPPEEPPKPDPQYNSAQYSVPPPAYPSSYNAAQQPNAGSAMTYKSSPQPPQNYSKPPIPNTPDGSSPTKAFNYNAGYSSSPVKPQQYSPQKAPQTYGQQSPHVAKGDISAQNSTPSNYRSNMVGPLQNFQEPPPNFGSQTANRPPDKNFEMGGKRPLENAPGINDAKKNKWEGDSGASKSQSRDQVKDFDKQFEDWEAQFNKWKEQNAGHPDKQQYREYEAQWESWRAQLLERRELMRRKRLNKLSTSPAAPATVTSAAVSPASVPVTSESDKPPEVAPNTDIVFKTHIASMKNDAKGTDDVVAENPKEQRSNSRQRNVDQESNEIKVDFLKSIQSDGIPGLDLVNTDENVKDVGKKNSEPDFEALSKGINSILGDEKLLNMLSMVSQNKNPNAFTPPARTNDLPTNVPNTQNPHNEQPTSSDDTYRQQFRNINDSRLNPQNSNRNDFNFAQFNQPPPIRGQSPRTQLVQPDYSQAPPNFTQVNRGVDEAQHNRASPQFSPVEQDENSFGFGSYSINRPENHGESKNQNMPHHMQEQSRQFGIAEQNNANQERDFNQACGPAPRNYYSNSESENLLRGEMARKTNQAPLNQSETQSLNRGNFPLNQRLLLGGDEYDSLSRERGTPNQGYEQNRQQPRPDYNISGPEEFTGLDYDHDDEFTRLESDQGGPPEEFEDDTAAMEHFERGESESPMGYNQSVLSDRGSTMAREGQPEEYGAMEEYVPMRYGRVGSEEYGSMGRGRGPSEDFGSMGRGRGPSDEYGSIGRGRGYNSMGRGRGSFDNFRGDYMRGRGYMSRGFQGGYSNYQQNPFDNIETGFNLDDGRDLDDGSQDYNEYYQMIRNQEMDRPQMSNMDPAKVRMHSAAQLIRQRHSIWDEALILKPSVVYDYGHITKEEKRLLEGKTFDYQHKGCVTLDVDDRTSSERQLPKQSFKSSSTRSDQANQKSEADQFKINSRDTNPEFRPRYDPMRRYDDRYTNMRGRPDKFGRDRYDQRVEDAKRGDDRFDRKFNERIGQNEGGMIQNRDGKNVEDMDLSVDMPAPVIMIDDILSPPGRATRPPRIAIILRGPPGSGKTFLAKLIKDKEVEQGGSAPRILSLDDYFMVESEKEVVEEETGRKSTVKKMVYEYEECMETAYRTSLDRAFKKTITDGYFNFIILDCVNEKLKNYVDMWSFAKQNGFQVYVCQLELDVANCSKQNIHGRTEAEIQKVVDGWEPTPVHHLKLDATSLIQSECISEVEMEEITQPTEEEKEEPEGQLFVSKWEKMEPSDDKLARLDGTSKPLRPSTRTMEDYLQLEDDIPEAKPGEKRVRWADLEEKRRQDKMRAIGFVVGQTDWGRMMDPTQGSSALTQTKYIERVRRF